MDGVTDLTDRHIHIRIYSGDCIQCAHEHLNSSCGSFSGPSTSVLAFLLPVSDFVSVSISIASGTKSGSMTGDMSIGERSRHTSRNLTPVCVQMLVPAATALEPDLGTVEMSTLRNISVSMI